MTEAVAVARAGSERGEMAPRTKRSAHTTSRSVPHTARTHTRVRRYFLPPPAGLANPTGSDEGARLHEQSVVRVGPSLHRVDPRMPCTFCQHAGPSGSCDQDVVLGCADEPPCD